MSTQNQTSYKVMQFSDLVSKLSKELRNVESDMAPKSDIKMVVRAEKPMVPNQHPSYKTMPFGDLVSNLSKELRNVESDIKTTKTD